MTITLFNLQTALAVHQYGALRVYILDVNYRVKQIVSDELNT